MLSKDDADEAVNASVNTVKMKPVRCRKYMQLHRRTFMV